MTELFEPIKIRDVTFRNRVGMSPMCQYSYQDGFSDEWQVAHLGSRAIGGAGLVLTEATAVSPVGRISPKDAGIWSDEHIKPLEKVTRIILSQGAVAGIQLAHAGRKACVERPWDGGKPLQPTHTDWWPSVGASPVSFNEEYQTPRELTKEDISQVKQEFVAAAKRALLAGFNLIEIHAGHGYLLHSFYSPVSNLRTDEYGGNFDNRIRLLVEVAQEIRKVMPEHFPLMVRISGTEWTEIGWNIEDSVSLARVLKKEGVDIIDCSSGGNIPGVRIPLTPGYQVPIADAVKNEANIITAAVGLITEPHQANEIIKTGKADLVLLGREFLRNPFWTINAARELNFPAPIPPQYLRAY